MAGSISITDKWHCVSCIHGCGLLLDGNIHNGCNCAPGVVDACLRNDYFMYEKHPAVRIISIGGGDECTDNDHQDGYKDGYRNGCKDTLHKVIQCLERNAEAYNGKLGIYDAINLLRVTEESYNET